MTTIQIAGREYPMALTLGAMSQLDEMCGGFDHVSDAFNGKTTMQVVDTLVQMLSILIRGGCDYQRGMGLEAPSRCVRRPCRPPCCPRTSPLPRTRSSGRCLRAWGARLTWSPTQKTPAPRRPAEPCVVLVLRIPNRHEQG